LAEYNLEARYETTSKMRIEHPLLAIHAQCAVLLKEENPPVERDWVKIFWDVCDNHPCLDVLRGHEELAFELILNYYAKTCDKTIDRIKYLRDLTRIGLKEAKSLDVCLITHKSAIEKIFREIEQ